MDVSLADLASQLAPVDTAFFFDVDGTLIDIAPHPDAVEVPSYLIDDLERLLAAASGALALVSGREAANIDALFQPLQLAVSGVHGAQMRLTPRGELIEVSHPLDGTLRHALSALASRFDGVLVEDKGASVALHYRNSPSLAPELEAEIARIIAVDSRNLTVLPGRMVFEVKRRGHDKGAAVRVFMAEPPFAGRTPVFLGDDVTDEAGFAAVREMGGIAISVGRRLPGADFTLSNAQDVRALIKRLAQFAERRD
ncbi:trehalose-phosphatase [Aquabacter sp. CN5-332]|uniref:trehalose-phosphatase n=1 Tax=Aquabacter sp. CN5-332 TaxID=3156608 RepID=UPI0032B5A655